MTGSARAGFSIAELVVALSLLGLIVTLLLHTLAGHQKALRGLRERILVSEQLRDGELALMSDIRGAAISADTLRLLADSAFEFFATMGSSVVCSAPVGQTVSLVPEQLSSGLLLTSMPVPPDTGDLVVIYARADSITGTRRWLRFRISAVTTASASLACPPDAGFTMMADAARAAYRITLIGALTSVDAGAPMRVLRRGRYSLYRSSDGEWYLGYKRCNAVATGCSTIQPVSGPYIPYSSSTGGGIRFRYLDSFGSPVPSARPLDVASIEVILRAEVSLEGRINGASRDSVLFTITPRNLH